MILIGSVLLVADAFLILDSLEEVEATSGWLPLFGWWTAGFYGLTLFGRWLGLYCYYRFDLRTRNRALHEAGAESSVG